MPDEASTRDHIQKHADAVARGDMAAVVADFSLAQAASIRRQNGRKAARAYSGCLRVGPSRERGNRHPPDERHVELTPMSVAAPR